MTELICRAVATPSGKVMFQSAETSGFTLQDQLTEDKKYGIMKPRNGKYFTFKVYGEDKEIKQPTIEMAVSLAFRRWQLVANLPKLYKAKSDEEPDFKFYFRTPQTDKLLYGSTLMYMYYPINDLNNPLRGTCVINSTFFWNVMGGSLPMNEIDPEHYPNPTTTKGITYDIDNITGHELGHALGLPHSKYPNNLMASNARIISEYVSDEDTARIQAKYGKTTTAAEKIKRFFEWLKIRSENY